MNEADTRPAYDAWYNNWGNGTAVSGWVVLNPDARLDELTIEARVGGVAIGEVRLQTAATERRYAFNVACRQAFKPIDVVTGALRLFARQPGDERETEVPAHQTLLTWMAKVAFSQNIFQHVKDMDTAKFLLQMLEGRFGPSLIADRTLEAPAAPVKNASQDLTALLHRVGTISKDRSAILGREGTIFLYEGSNTLFTQYQQPELSEAGQKLAAQWTGIIAGRVEFFAKRNIPFAQIIIPEKTCALQSRFPIAIKTPTRLLAAIESWAKSNPTICANNYVSMIDAFTAMPDVEEYYLKTDSHFSARGALAATRVLLGTLAAQNKTVADAMPAIETLFERALSPGNPSRFVIGDLATRFFGVPLYDEDIDIRYETLFGGTNRVVLDEHFTPPGGNLTNTRMVWHHPEAPLDLRVVAFGNSFFERGGAATTLSWWFKHLCREFHLVWSREVDLKYVDDVRPDAVVCQTIERFLTVVPKV
jgi:hypothetical protein